MENTVKARPNHYEILGLKPTASGDEIARAFTREISVTRPRAFGGLAELSIAYETLRNPASRRSYDESLGLKPEPRRSTPAPKEFKLFMVHASARPAERPPSNAMPTPIAKSEPQPGRERPVDPRVASIAASLRGLAKPAKVDAVPNSSPRSEQQPDPRADVGIETIVEEILADGYAAKGRLGHVGNRAPEWKRVALAGGALIVGAGILGALAGLDAGNAVQKPQPEPALTIPVPAPKATPGTIAASAGPARPEARSQQPRHRRFAEPRTVRELPSERLAGLEQQLEAPQSEETPVEQAAADSAPVAATPAKMPLSDATIARTIGRIGYSCGAVASVEGEAEGVFKVTCTSGQSYRAAPVRGRYRFRRLSNP